MKLKTWKLIRWKRMQMYNPQLCSFRRRHVRIILPSFFFKLIPPNNCWAWGVVYILLFFFEADLMGTRPTHLGIGKAFLADKVRCTPVLLSKSKLEIRFLVSKAIIVFDCRYPVQRGAYSCKQNYCI